MSAKGRRAFAAVCLLVGLARAEEMTLNVNVKRPVAVVSDKFLSFTLDPVVLFNGESLNDVERSTSMAKALAPAYVRIGGPRSNSYTFERGLYPQASHADPGYSFTENHWIQVHQWAKRSGLDVIACIAPHQSDVSNNARTQSSWDPRNALDLISFSDHMGYNTSWQLGYECQTRCESSGAELGRDVQRLRNMLDAFPRYADRSLIAGPDVVTYKTRLQQQYLQEYFANAASALSAVTWHPDLAGISIEAEGVSMHHDNLALEKDSFYRVAGRHITKKPLWIAESKPEECKKQFLGALVWTRRLGNAAKIGVQVVMRQPDNSNLFKATPDYWVSLLHKQLVGREVLDTKIASGNRTHAHFYCQCTKPSPRYESGSLTVFGINLTPTKITAGLRGLKLKVVHKYILLPGYDAPNRLFAETILLNNQPLSLIDGKEVPEVQPVIANAEKGVKLKLPSGGIGFWVLPDLKIKACMGHDDDLPDKNLLKRINKRLEELENEEESETDDGSREPGDPLESEERKSTARQTTQKRSPAHRGGLRADRDEQNSRRVRRLDHGARHDHLHRRASSKSGAGHGVFERSKEEENDSSDGGKIGKNSSGSKIDSGEVIRAKLEEYKKRLADHESKRNHRELMSNMHKERLKAELDDSTNKAMETEKVIETLALITEVENAMKGLEKEAVAEDQAPSSNAPTLEAEDFPDVISGPRQDRTQGAMERGDDPLLDEVLNTEKAKRTSVPTMIEDQLKALYRLLSEEKQKRESQIGVRQRRDLEKLSQPEEVLLVRKRSKNDEIKERIMERINERKQKLKGRQLQRREREEKKDHDSGEDSFYGFPRREPLQDFPRGDLYLQSDIDLTDKGGLGDKQKQDGHADIWLEGGGKRMPNEFFENLNAKGRSSKENLKNYGELWEAEALHKEAVAGKQTSAQSVDLTNQPVIVTEKPILRPEDPKEKHKTAQQFYNLHQTDPAEKRYNFDDFRRIQPAHYQPQALPHYPQTQENAEFYKPEYSEYIDPYYADPAHLQSPHVPYPPGAPIHPAPVVYPHLPTNQVAYPRVKRHVNDLEAVLHKEMIMQDDNNLRDCQCRVIRGVEVCDVACDEEQEDDVDSMPGEPTQMPNSHIRSRRIRRDAEEAQIYPENGDTVVYVVEEPAVYASQETEAPTESTEQEEEEPTVDLEISLEDPDEAKEPEVYATTADMEPHTYGDSEAANRLPRKIEHSSKFLALRESKAANKKKSQKNKEEVDTSTNNPAASAGAVGIDELEVADERVANIRSVDGSIGQIPSANSVKATPETAQGAANRKQPFRVQSFASTFATPSFGTEAVTQKSEGTGADSQSDFANNGDEARAKKEIESAGNQTTATPVLNKATLARNSIVVMTKAPTTKAAKRSESEVPAANGKSKANSNSTKMDDAAKTRHTRLTTRAEALAALKKENESRRVKKMIEASMKLLEIEKARFAEHQRKRRDQLERLKSKLRAKREKMLQQYREELIEAINESADTKESNVHRRDLLDKYGNPNDDLGKSDKVTDPEKLAFIMRYRPVKYESDDDLFESKENNKYIPIIEVMKSNREAKRRYDFEDVGNNDKRYKELNKYLTDDEMYNSSNEQEFRSTNRKRSPYSYSNSYGDIEREAQYLHPLEQQQQQTPEYYSQSTYRSEGDIPLQMKYNQQPSYDGNQENTQYEQTYYESNRDNEKPGINYYEENQENNQQQYDENYYAHQPTHQEANQEPTQQNYQKAKRSSSRIIEIDPSIYAEDDEYYLDGFHRPSSRLTSRIYRHDPHAYNRRYKRTIDVKNEEDESSGPMFFSLGLEQSQMFQRNPEQFSVPDVLARKKRSAVDLHEGKAALNKNVKKVYKADSESKYAKHPKSLRRKRQIENYLRPKRVEEPDWFELVDDIPLKIKSYDSSKVSTLENYLRPSMKKPEFNFNDFLDDLRSEKNLFTRKRRSFDENDRRSQLLANNAIDRSIDSEMDEIWNNIIDLREDEELLRELDRQKNKVFPESQESTTNLPQNETAPTTSKSHSSSTQVNIESMIADAIPKLGVVITGGLKKAENLTGSLEDFIENFDGQVDETSEGLNATSESADVDEANDGSISHNVFRVMVGGVNKFFKLLSNITQVFQGH